MSAVTRFVLLKATTTNRLAYTPVKGELVFDTDLNQVYAGDGSTAGGNVVGVAVSNEDIQDVVGSLIGDSTTIDVTYDDAGNVLTMDVIPGAVDHDALLNFVGNEHINHSSVEINTDSTLTGGGDITATRTIGMPNSGVTAGSYTSTDLTVDAQGRITAASSGIAATPIFGSEFSRAFFDTNVSFSTSTLFEIYQESLTSRPPGTYRIMIHYAYEPGSTGANDHSEIRVNGSTANIEQRTFEDEGKDSGGDIMRTNVLLGYYTKTTTSTFTIELYARNEGGTTVIKGATIESWRVL